MKLTIKGFQNPETRKALEIILNDIVASRVEHEPMPYEELVGYLNAQQDIYNELTGSEKGFEIKKEVRELLENLEKGNIKVVPANHKDEINQKQ